MRIALDFKMRPFPAIRATRGSRFDKKVRDYQAKVEALRIEARALGYDFPDSTKILSLAIDFHFAMPASWPRKKRFALYSRQHRQKPDLDNLLKAVQDSLFPRGDSGIAHYGVMAKYWDFDDSINVVIHTDDDL